MRGLSSSRGISCGRAELADDRVRLCHGRKLVDDGERLDPEFPRLRVGRCKESKTCRFRLREYCPAAIVETARQRVSWPRSDSDARETLQSD